MKLHLGLWSLYKKDMTREIMNAADKLPYLPTCDLDTGYQVLKDKLEAYVECTGKHGEAIKSKQLYTYNANFSGLPVSPV